MTRSSPRLALLFSASLPLALAACANAPRAPVGDPAVDGANAAAPTLARTSSAATPVIAPLARPYAADAARIVARALAEDGAYEKLAYLTDRVGHRLAGEPSLDRAITWAETAMAHDGLANVRREVVMVPKWVRGDAKGAIVAPSSHKLFLLALGGSPSTPAGGVTAPVVVVSSFEELEALGAANVAGKIVVYDTPLPPYGPKGSGYGEKVVFRGSGPSRASKLGAVAALVRSMTATSLRSAHTGVTHFDAGVAPIPAASLTAEDAALIARLARQGKVEVHLELGAHFEPDVASANVVGELVGKERPNEVVLIGAHLDSWDVGQGAHDDGAGCVIVMEALHVLKALGLEPRRTIRVVLFTNEENGGRGAEGYAKAHAAELGDHVAAIEADSGGFRPLGFRAQAKDAAVEVELRALATLLASVGATSIEKGHGGADIGRLEAAGVPLLGLDVEGSRYFDYHHTEADTLDKVRPDELRADVATMAVMAWALANVPERLGKNAGADDPGRAGAQGGPKR